MLNNFKKINLFFFLIIFISTQSFSNIKIEVKVNNEIITNYDIKKELTYLKILNPNLSTLDEYQSYKIATKSLINEIIKKKEIEKKFNLLEENKILNEVFTNLLQKLNIKDEKDFQKLLKENNSYSIEEIKKKLKIELYWNDIIFIIFKNQVKIDTNELLKKIDDQANLIKYRYFLSEIVFTKKKEENLQYLISQISESITKNGFNNTANIYSISETSKFGGKVGWIEEDNLSEIILSKLDNLEPGQITEVIRIYNNYVILKVEDKELIKNNFNRNEELKRLINYERNKQLNQFSNIYFAKVKMNYDLNEK